MAGREPMATIDESSIGRTQIFNQVLTVAQRNTRMTSGHLCFGVIRIKVYIGENSAVRIPAADVCILFAQGKLLSR